MPAVDRAGVIHDIGYQRYTGLRLGRAYAVRSLYVHSLRGAFGMGRSVKAKIFPAIIIGILMLIAVVSVVIRTQIGRLGVPYVNFPGTAGLLSGLFLCSVAPELISRDLRAKVLPLYFSRPITRTDYALAKLGATISAAMLVLSAPILFMYIGSAFSLPHAGDIWDETGRLLVGLGVATIYAVVYATIASLLSSLFGRRVVAAAVIVGYFMLTAAVTVVIGGITQGTGRVFHISLVLNPAFMLEGVKQWIHGETTHFDTATYGPWYTGCAVAVVVIGTGLLLLRYRKVEA